jgi:hypothetical protein
VTDYRELIDYLSSSDTCADTTAFWQSIVIPEVAVYVPGMDDAALVDESTPLDSFVATKSGGFDFSGETNDKIYDNFFQAKSDQSRRQIDKTQPGDAPWKVVRRNQPDLTLAQYNAATGEATIECYEDGDVYHSY